MTRPLVWALAALSVTALAAAQPLADEALEARLRRGVELRRAGNDAAAFDEFEAAYAMRAEGRTAAQLGLVSQATGRWVRAEALLREALASEADPWVGRNRAALEGALAVVARHLGSLEVVGEGGSLPDGAEIRVNRAVVGRAPLTEALRVEAGQIVLEVSAPGYDTLARRFEIAPGERLRERVTLVRVPVRENTPAAPVMPTPAALPTPERAPEVRVVEVVRTPWRPLAAASATVGVAALAVGVSALVWRNAAVASFNEGCAASEVAGACGDWRAETHFAEGVAVVSLPVAALAVGFGVVAWIRGGPRGALPRADACGVSAGGARCGWQF
ncbi:MAG: PEGA domain-containing protein [Myxococcales bacterium]|nr:PEGA domain-containing protein [Myxococcales bacterium]